MGSGGGGAVKELLGLEASPGPVKAESWTGPRAVLEGEFLPLPGQCVAIPLHLTEINLTRVALWAGTLFALASCRGRGLFWGLSPSLRSIALLLLQPLTAALRH